MWPARSARPARPLQHMGDVGAGEAVIAVTALFLRLDQPAGLELRQMRTRGLRRDAGLLRQLARGQRAAGHQRGQHVGARGIADQGGDHGDVGACFHSSMIAEASTSSKRVCRLRARSSLRGASDEAIHLSACGAWIASLRARNDGNHIGGPHDHHRFHPLPARSVQARAVRAVFEKLAHHHPEMRRRPASATGCRTRAPTTSPSR